MGKQWDEAGFFYHLSKRGIPEEVEIANKILDWAKKNTADVWWGKGRVTGSFVPKYNTSKGQHYQLFAVFTSGTIQIYFGVYKERPEFKEDSKRIELLDKLNSIVGVKIPPDGIDRYPSFPINALKNEQALRQFFETYEWFLEVIK